jgi:hypothetical protein
MFVLPYVSNYRFTAGGFFLSDGGLYHGNQGRQEKFSDGRVALSVLCEGRTLAPNASAVSRPSGRQKLL